jgi:hypothetical protein
MPHVLDSIACSRRVLLTALAALLLVPAGARAADHEISIVIRDHKFEPSEIEVPANTPLRIKVRNQDKTPEEFESLGMRVEKIIPGGRELTVTVNPLRPGRYKFFGEFNPDTAIGYITAK